MKHNTPHLFTALITMGCISGDELCCTDDGFRAAEPSLAEILSRRQITAFPDSEGVMQPCSLYFDDWHLYAVECEGGHVYSLFKLREQEHDGGDGDTPGVTVSFIAFDENTLINCLDSPSTDHTSALSHEINRVVAHAGQTHHTALKDYFDRASAQGPYLIAQMYVQHIASFAGDGSLPVPEAYGQLYSRFTAGEADDKERRIPDFINGNNVKAGSTVCDHERIYIGDPKQLTMPEKYAILATHTACTSFNCFAAEVQFHARFLFGLARIPIPFIGRSVYDSAIRADMSIDDSEFEGPAPYHDPNSHWVKQQLEYHEEY